VEGMGQPVAAGQQQRQGMRRRRQFGSRCWAAVVNRLELGQAAEVVSGGHSLPDQEGDMELVCRVPRCAVTVRCGAAPAHYLQGVRGILVM
jgi:sorbitol-specific phosphotransferase system component IIBC